MTGEFVVFCPRCLRGKTRASAADVAAWTTRCCAHCAKSTPTASQYASPENTRLIRFEAVAHHEEWAVQLRARMRQKWLT